MSDDIPFDKDLNLAPHGGRTDAWRAPDHANNPGPFTNDGELPRPRKYRDCRSCPDDAAHIGALLEAVRNETVTHIFVTHTH